MSESSLGRGAVESLQKEAKIKKGGVGLDTFSIYGERLKSACELALGLGFCTMACSARAQVF